MSIARFKQTDADVGSFDGGYGSAYLARQVGQKFAREIFLAAPTPPNRCTTWERSTRWSTTPTGRPSPWDWAGERSNGKSPQAQRMLEIAFSLLDDGLVGQQLFAGEATRLAYMTDEAVEGRDAFLEKRAPTGAPSPLL